jgi:Flp pilus assembly protein TadD
MPRLPHRLFAAGAVLFLCGAVTARADVYSDIQGQIDSGRLKEAAAAASQLTGSNPSDCRAWQLQGDAFRRLSRIDAATDAYRKGLEACADDKGLLTALGMLYDETEQYEDAVKILDRLWTLDSSDPTVGSRLGAAAYRAGRCAEGRRAYEALLKAHPDRANDRLAYAQLLTRSCKDYAAAETEYRALLSSRSTDPSIHCALAYLLSAAGRVDEAVQTAEKGIGVIQGDPGCLYAAWGRALASGGDSLMVKGQIDQARDFYRRAMVPLSKGTSDPVFGNYCQAILAEVKYKEAPMEELAR